MNRIIKTLLIGILLICSCVSVPKKKDIGQIIVNKVEEISVEGTSLAEVIVVQNLNNPLIWLILGVFAGIVLFVSGVRVIGIAVLAASVTCIVLILTMSLYMKYVAMVGLLVLVVGCWFLFKNLYDNSRLKKDFVKSVDSAISLIPAEKREVLKKALNGIQTPFTKKVVQKIKGD